MNNKTISVNKTHNETLYVNVLVNNDRLKTYNKDYNPPIPHYYLKNGTEFSLEFMSTYSTNIGIIIKINGTKLSDSHLIIKPGERVTLDRYIENNNRFLFNEYSLGNTDDELTPHRKNAYIDSKIGTIDISVYKEVEILNSNYIPTYPTFPTYSSTGIPNVYYRTTTFSSDVSYNSDIKSLSLPNEEVAGEIKEGSTSNQVLTTTNMDFSTYCSQTINMRLYPISYKPIEKSDLINYCSECGKKQKQGNRFCPNCGNRL